jgi:hypothetical protein
MVDGLMSKRLKADAGGPETGPSWPASVGISCAALRERMILRCFPLRGNPSGEIAGVAARSSLLIIRQTARQLRLPGETASGGSMDLAMAMGVALFGMFAASTFYFFHKLGR